MDTTAAEDVAEDLSQRIADLMDAMAARIAATGQAWLVALLCGAKVAAAGVSCSPDPEGAVVRLAWVVREMALEMGEDLRDDVKH